MISRPRQRGSCWILESDGRKCPAAVRNPFTPAVAFHFTLAPYIRKLTMQIDWALARLASSCYDYNCLSSSRVTPRHRAGAPKSFPLGRNQRNEIIRRAATHKSDAQLMAKWVENQTRWKERERSKRSYSRSSSNEKRKRTTQFNYSWSAFLK